VTSRPDLWIYREGKRVEPAEHLRAAVAACLAKGATVDALVIAGELEAALADARAASLPDAVAITDALATEMLGGPLAACDPETLALPDELVLSTAEGFAYYGLHPRSYEIAAVEQGIALVVGVRSIGTTLSAVTKAALRRRGIPSERITVRPTGHPYDRRLESVPTAPPQATIVIVDEGPGLSGSTFLAVAEAFVRAGISPDRIVLVCSRTPPLDALFATDARSRWEPFRTIVAPSNPWPAAGGRVIELVGLGRSGLRARHRARVLAEERLCPAFSEETDGFISMSRGSPLSIRDLDAEMLDRIARYIGRRTQLFPEPSASDLTPVIAKNARAIGLDAPPRLDIARPTIVDGRLSPETWHRHGASVLKTDALLHGDGHVFPGPTDAAWDLAGAAIEWQLDEPAEARLLDTYRAVTDDDARPRLRAWKQAYAVLHAALDLSAR
jgi:hypothetical protein